MTKLDEIIWNVEKGYCDADEFKRELLNAARAYSALQKLAPEIVALVEAGEKAFNETNWYGKRFQEHGKLNQVLIEPTLGVVYGGHDEALANADFIIKAANTRPALKAIHDELKKWGE